MSLLRAGSFLVESLCDPPKNVNPSLIKNAEHESRFWCLHQKRSCSTRLPRLLAVCLFLACAPAWAAPQFPPLTGRVVDQANILSPETETTLTAKLQSLETSTGHQLVVATLNSLQGYEIEEYGYQLGRAWGIGRAAENDGVLLIVAPNERSVRIEVGYGLEGVLTDALSSVILNQRVLPLFKQGELEDGVVAGADALIEQLSLPEEEAGRRVAQARQTSENGSHDFPSLFTIIVVIWIVLMILRAFGPRRRRRGGWPWILPPIVIDGGRRGGWGGGWGGGWSGGGGGGGGFSGGGGSFGGGGASGKW